MSQEYEILEAAFAQAGRDLEEARASKSLLTQQLDGSERERGALSQRVRSLEALAASRQVDAAEQAAREKVASTILAEKDAALSAQAEDLRLERNIVLATRQQVDAAEADSWYAEPKADAHGVCRQVDVRHDVSHNVGGEFGERALLVVPPAGHAEEGQDGSYAVSRRGPLQSRGEGGHQQVLDLLAALDI